MITAAFVTPILPASSHPHSAHRFSCSASSPSSPPSTALHALWNSLRTLELITRPGHASSQLERRYNALPDSAKIPSQMLGRLTPGCEGTKGVFPRCNFACTPCYHSSSANKVRTDGIHTVTEVARQMQMLQKERGNVGHCQLIGGEVSLLSPDEHALALETMRFFGRIPMSFTHGDFDYDYLYKLAIKDGKKRFDRLDFAVHFDMGMRGRKGIPKPKDEMQLTPFRRRLVDMFERLRRETGVEHYLAHNMTVQSCNIDMVPQAVAEMKGMRFRLLSFQPAALQGERRVAHAENVREDHGESVWKQIERGMGCRLPYSLFQMGDVRCNRMAVCGILGDKQSTAFPLFDDQCPQDATCRDLIFRHVGNIVLMPRVLALKITRVLFSRPWLLIPFFLWVARLVSRAGGLWPIYRHGVRVLTIVMHRFMDAEDVKQAWSLMQDGVQPEDERAERAGGRVKETMERLMSCSYGMAQPENGQVVPACVQHSVYDPEENERLAQLLPLRSKAKAETLAES